MTKLFLFWSESVWMWRLGYCALMHMFLLAQYFNIYGESEWTWLPCLQLSFIIWQPSLSYGIDMVRS